MADEQKRVSGGFRSTLALIISIIALVFSIIAYRGTEARSDFGVQMKELQKKMDKIKSETAEQVSRAREETAKALEKLGNALKQD